MTNIRVKIATAATILGLGGLGGFAMASNPAYDTQASAPIQVAATQAGSARQAGSAPATSQFIVTGASGATSPAVPLATQPAPAAKPVVTHAVAVVPARAEGPRARATTQQSSTRTDRRSAPVRGLAAVCSAPSSGPNWPGSPLAVCGARAAIEK